MPESRRIGMNAVEAGSGKITELFKLLTWVFIDCF